VIASARAVVEPGGVLRTAHSAPPLTIRQVRSDRPDVCAICLVGSAAGPLAGDRVELDLTVRPGALADVVSAGALVAQGRPGGAGSVLRTRADVGAGASLVSRPAPLVVCAGSSVVVSVEVDLADSAHLVWREVVVLGRTGEPPGDVTLDWDVRRGGRPLLRQRTVLTGPSPWAGLTRGRRVFATELQVGPDIDAVTVIRTSTAVSQRVAPGGRLLTVLADDAADAMVELAALAELSAAPARVAAGE
jgi:urease accessory protein